MTVKIYKVYKVDNGCRIATFVTKEFKEEICEDSKMWALVKWVGKVFPQQINKQKFRMIHDVVCKLYEYKPDRQTRYFAQILSGYGLVIYHKCGKKRRSLKTAEYNEICRKFQSILKGE